MEFLKKFALAELLLAVVIVAVAVLALAFGAKPLAFGILFASAVLSAVHLGRKPSRRTGIFCTGMAFALVMVSILPGCTGSGVKEQRDIAAACTGITAAVNAIAAGAEHGQVSKADAAKALSIAKPTAAFCEPKPADHLSPADYAALLNAAADLAARKGALR